MNYLLIPQRLEPTNVPVYCDVCAGYVERGEDVWCSACGQVFHQDCFWDVDAEYCAACTKSLLVRAEWKLAALRRDDLAERVAAEILEGRC